MRAKLLAIDSIYISAVRRLTNFKVNKGDLSGVKRLATLLSTGILNGLWKKSLKTLCKFKPFPHS